jgi:hypothetical protein
MKKKIDLKSIFFFRISKCSQDFLAISRTIRFEFGIFVLQTKKKQTGKFIMNFSGS